MKISYEEYPPEDQKYRFVLQAHVRGRSVHLDFRYEFLKGKVLLGWTLNAIKSIPYAPKNLKEAKKLVYQKMNQFVKEVKDPNIKWVVEEKAPEPWPWLDIDNATFEKGTVGATKNYPGFMFILDLGTIEYGAQKPHYHELFLYGTKRWKRKKIFDGRMVFRQLPNVWRKKSIHTGEPSKTGEGYLVTFAWLVDPEPYAISKRAIDEEWYPPPSISALPKAVRTQIPQEFRYWKVKNATKYKQVRDDLIKALKEKSLALKYSEPTLLIKKAMYLVEPHGKMIFDGDKTLIIKARDFKNMAGLDMYLISGDLCYGIINIDKPTRISNKDFFDRQDEHKISKAEALKWWGVRPGGKSKLYAYKFKIKTLRPPLSVKIPHGTQTFIHADNIKFAGKKEKIDSVISKLLESEWE